MEVDALGLMNGLEVKKKYKVRTHCNRGHEFTPENTYYKKTPERTYRLCKECEKRRNHKNYLRRTGRIEIAPKTHCKNNHEWISKNIYTAPNGNQTCKICKREKRRNYYLTVGV